jgi:hypothetical protein
MQGFSHACEYSPQQWGTFKACKEAIKAYVEQRKAVKQAKDALALLTAPASKGEGKKTSKKASEKSSKKAPEKALQKTKEGAALANTPAPELHAVLGLYNILDWYGGYVCTCTYRQKIDPS